MKNRIRELRARDRLTQDELATAVGVTRQTIIAIENERYGPTLELAFKIAGIFKLKVEDVFSRGKA